MSFSPPPPPPLNETLTLVELNNPVLQHSKIKFDLVFVCAGVRISGAGMGHNLAGLTYYPSNRDDPYITLKEQVNMWVWSGVW